MIWGLLPLGVIFLVTSSLDLSRGAEGGVYDVFDSKGGYEWKKRGQSGPSETSLNGCGCALTG